MATDEGHETAGRSRVQIALVVGCVLAAVLAALLVPTLASGDLAGSPIDSILPGERFDDGSGSGTGGSGSGFGALNPGDQTGIGGDTGFDNETFGANDTEVHFVVESSKRAYWRTGSYDTYTGTGWERDSPTTAFDPPLEPVGLTDGQLEFELTFAESATAVPTAWQPRSVSGVEDPELTEGGAIRTSQLLEPGTTVSGVSQLQENDVDVLRAAGEDYPEDLAGQYTQLPADTPDRVGEFTDELTADDETPYDAAMTIQNWLRSEKGYSLEADRRSEHMADTFIFEMEEGYCEYFATAMTAMLRSQDIPARYTIGYSTGQPVGENTYEVRGMNAHAWVEVYFPEVGWVKFDPTPGGSRLNTQSAVLEDELGEEFDLEEPGSPGETFQPGQITDRTDTDEESNESDGRYEISLNRTAVPGLPVEIRVTEDGDPAPDRVVSVNGEEVGRTDGDGAVVITVPDVDELRIEVRPPDPVFDVNEGPARDSGVTRGPSVAPGDDELLYSYGSDDELLTSYGFDGELLTSYGVNGADLLLADSSTDDEDLNVTVPDLVDLDNEANTTVDVETDATLSVTGDLLPGETVTVTAMVQDVAIPDATVTLDGEEIGRTDENGRTTVTLPAEPGNATLAVERGPVSGEEVVTVPGLELSVSTGPIPLPFTTATVEVTAGERSIASAPVVVDGEQVGTTGADGTADVRLPLSPAATVEASHYGMTDSETVDGLLLNLGLVGVVAGVLVVVPAALARRLNRSLDGIRSGIARTLDRFARATQLALLGAVRHGPAWLASIPDRIRTTLVHLLDAVRGRRSPAELKGLLLAWFTAKRQHLWHAPVAESTAEPAHVEDGIQQTWEQFLSHVSVADPSAHTPGELATHAIEVDGLPTKPVRMLLTNFRAVEYGSRPEKRHLDQAQRALTQLDGEGEENRSDAGDGDRAPRPDGLSEGVSADGGRRTGESPAPNDGEYCERQSDGGSG